jgi:hypothetical protein
MNQMTQHCGKNLPRNYLQMLKLKARSHKVHD